MARCYVEVLALNGGMVNLQGHSDRHSEGHVGPECKCLHGGVCRLHRSTSTELPAAAGHHAQHPRIALRDFHKHRPIHPVRASHKGTPLYSHGTLLVCDGHNTTPDL